MKLSKGKLLLCLKGVFCLFVLVDVNLWMGRNLILMLSGLYYDYYDNLYVLVRGEKIFKVFFLCDVGCMYMIGKICWVYENGFINYKGVSMF